MTVFYQPTSKLSRRKDGRTNRIGLRPKERSKKERAITRALLVDEAVAMCKETGCATTARLCQKVQGLHKNAIVKALEHGVNTGVLRMSEHLITTTSHYRHPVYILADQADTPPIDVESFDDRAKHFYDTAMTDAVKAHPKCKAKQVEYALNYMCAWMSTITSLIGHVNTRRKVV